MREIAFFGEDHAHERIVGALIRRLAQDRCMHIKMDKRSMRGGYGRVVREFTIYLHDLQRQQYPMPDLVVIATDTNCAGWQKRRQDIDKASNVAEINIPLVQALPDPHIERWLLLDGAAFRKVCGKGCQAPDQKCDRHRYKNLLIDAALCSVCPDQGTAYRIVQ